MRNLLQAILCLIACPPLAARAACLSSQVMKTFLWIPITLVLLPAVAWTQALPDAPEPAPAYAQASAPPDAKWNRIQQLSDGEEVVVSTTSGTLVRCRFAGATDTCLFCDPPGALPSQASYRFERANVVSVKQDQPERDTHPVLLAAVVILGSAVGFATTRNSSDRVAATAGVFTAVAVGTFGYSMADTQSQNAGFGFVFRPHGFGRGAAGPPGRRPRMMNPIRPMRPIAPAR